MDKVSVIVPAYNVSDYIEVCIGSLENQTYKNLEIIIVEDCSADNTWEICCRLEKQYANIILVRHRENLGQEASREDGIAVATGKWIMFLDADDTYLPDGVERVMVFAQEYDPDFILCPYAKVIDGVSTPPRTLGMEQGIHSPREICSKVFTDLSMDILSCIGSKAYSRDFIVRNKIHFDRRFRFNEDGGFIYACLMHAVRIFAADIPFYQYTIRTSGSIQSSYRENMFQTISNADHFLREVLMHYECFTEDRKAGYYFRRASTMLASLHNESRYRSFSSFCAVSGEIRADQDFPSVYGLAMEGKFSRAMKIMATCTKFHMEILLYPALRFRR